MISRLDCNGNTTAEWLRAMADMEHGYVQDTSLTPVSLDHVSENKIVADLEHGQVGHGETGSTPDASECKAAAASE